MKYYFSFSQQIIYVGGRWWVISGKDPLIAHYSNLLILS